MINIFLIVADFLRLSCMTLLLRKIWKTRSSAGISSGTQKLLAIAYTTRYLDPFLDFSSTYCIFMTFYVNFYRILTLATSYVTVFLMCVSFKETKDLSNDNFMLKRLLAISLVLALYFNYYFSIDEIMWAFSEFLEAVALIPQIYMVIVLGEVDITVNSYVFLFGSYRGLYVINWIYRYLTEGHFDPISSACGVFQTEIALALVISQTLRALGCSSITKISITEPSADLYCQTVDSFDGKIIGTSNNRLVLTSSDNSISKPKSPHSDYSKPYLR